MICIKCNRILSKTEIANYFPKDDIWVCDKCMMKYGSDSQKKKMITRITGDFPHTKM